MPRIKRISIRNIMGVEELDFEPGSVTLVTGTNASGKSSVLAAVKSVVEGGHDATLLRQGEEVGETVIVFDDDVELQKKVRAHKSDLTGRHPTMGRISAAQTYVAGLTDSLSVNPVAFLTASDRAEKLLEAMPLRIEKAVLEEAIDGTDVYVPDMNGTHALEAIETVRKRVYEERTGVNRVAKEQRTTAEQLADSLPSDFESATVLENQVHDAEGAHRDAERTLTQKLGGVDTEAEKRIAGTKEEGAKIKDGVHREAAEKVEALRADIEKLRETIRELEGQVEKVGAEARDAMHEVDMDVQREVERLREAATVAKQDLMVEHRPKVNELAARVTELRERIKAADRYENTRKMLEDARAKAGEYEGRGEALTEALGRLERLKGDLLDDLPIPGVEIRDREVYKDGVPFPRLNHAEQVKLAVAVAKLRAGDFPLVCVDGLECLDEEPFRLFVEELAASGLQGIVARVTPGPLTVTSIGGAVAHV